MNGFFAPYAYLGMIVFAIFILIIFITGIMLGKIIGKKWTVFWTIIIGCVIFYFFDLDVTFLILGFFAISVSYIYFFKKFNKKTKKLK